MPAPRSLDPRVVLLVEPPHLLEEGIAQRAGVFEERSLLYHSMVLLRPSSKGTCARKPKRRSAREVSRQRRGCPSGLFGIPEDPSREAHELRDELGQRPYRDLEARPQVHWLRSAVALRGHADAACGVVYVQEFARGLARAPGLDGVGPVVQRVLHLLDEGGNDVGERGIEVVAGSVEVDGQEVHDVEAVLLPIGLALHEQHLLGEAVGGVRFLRVAGPDLVLPERHGRELGVRADRAHGQDLLHTGEAAFLDELDPHHQVVEEERAGIVAVGADASHARGQVQDEVGLRGRRAAARTRPGSTRSYSFLRGTKTSRAPRRESSSTTWLPRNPEPPVTTIL